MLSLNNAEPTKSASAENTKDLAATQKITDELCFKDITALVGHDHSNCVQCFLTAYDFLWKNCPHRGKRTLKEKSSIFQRNLCKLHAYCMVDYHGQ